MGQPRAHGIVRVAAKYGLMLGVLSLLIFLVQTRIGVRQNNWPVTLANAVVLIVLMVLAHGEIKRSRDGVLSYAHGLGAGTLLAATGALIRGVLAYVYMKYLGTGYLAAVVQAQRLALERRGITGERAQVAMGITASLTSPAGVAVLSLLGGVVLGFIAALIVSVFTQSEGRMVVT
jgi:Protein of unknown function (DUF4199)